MVSIAITGAQTKRAAVLSHEENAEHSQEQMSFQGMSAACSTEYHVQFFSISPLSNFSLYLLACVILVT